MGLDWKGEAGIGQERNSMENNVPRNDYDRVTSVIGAFTDLSHIPPDVLEAKTELGHLVHKYIEMTLLGEKLHVIPDEVKGYLSSFEAFRRDNEHNWDLATLEIERRLYCDVRKITGQIDLMVYGNGKTYLFDWKTSRSMYKSYRLQAAAYKYLAEANNFPNVESLCFVLLKQDGKKASLHKTEDSREDLDMFFKALDVYRWFELNKKRDDGGSNT